MPTSPLTGDAVDRKGQRLIVERFREHHRQRLARVRAPLEGDARVMLDALPLLIHVNHPALPGFVDYDMPAGIDRYTPEAPAIAAVRQIALSYTPERLIERTRHLQAVFLVPAEDPAAPHEVWVCCRETCHEALHGKLDAMVAFAGRRGLALKHRIVDPLTVRAGGAGPGGLPALALDRFYLSAVWLAGRYPLWWLVPRTQEARYAEYAGRLQQQRFVAADETFDFGPVPRVPQEEWLREGLEALERAIDDPYAALPGLMLIEARTTRAHTSPGLLAPAYKEQVHNTRTAGPELDAERIVLSEIERYLSSTDGGSPDAGWERLAFVRRVCLLGCARPDVFAPLLNEWQPGSSTAAALEQTNDGYKVGRWPLKRRIEENALLDAELERAARVLQTLHKELPEELLRRDPEIERRLSLVTGRLLRPSQQEGAIRAPHPALLIEPSSHPVEIVKTDDRWSIREAGSVLFESSRLAAAAVWLHLHGVQDGTLRIEDDAVRSRVARVRSVLREAMPAGQRAAGVTILLINAEHESPDERLTGESSLLSEWDDPLDYSGYHQNLILGIDRILTGRDVRSAGGDGPSVLLQTLETALAAEPDKTRCFCVATTHRRAIEDRINELIGEMRSTFHDDAASARFVFPTGAGFTVVTRDPSSKLQFVTAADDVALSALLRTQLPPGRPVTRADQRSRRLGWLRQLSELIEVGRSALLVAADGRTPELTLHLAHSDGSIHSFIVPTRPLEQLAGELFAFFSRQKLQGATLPRIYTASGGGLTEVRVPPLHRTPALALRVRREPGRVDIHHGNNRWSNVPVNEQVLDELVASFGATARLDATARPDLVSPSLSDVAFEADSPRLPERLALKFAFERRLLERIRITR